PRRTASRARPHPLHQTLASRLRRFRRDLLDAFRVHASLRYNAQQSTFRFPNGALLEVNQLESASDYAKFQGRIAAAGFPGLLLETVEHVNSLFKLATYITRNQPSGQLMCSRRLNFDPPCRLNIDTGMGADCWKERLWINVGGLPIIVFLLVHDRDARG